MKQIFLSAFLLTFASFSFSNPIIAAITGADMVGIEVTAEFSGGFSETLVWGVTGTDALIPNGEGFSGGVFGNDWSLSQQGYTVGNLSGNDILGLWTLTNNTSTNLLTLTINAMAGDIAFDQFLDDEWTVGSGVGRTFLPDGSAQVAGLYSDLYSDPDLWGSLSLSFDGLAPASTFQFLADTDKVSVPVPGSLALLVLGLFGLNLSRKQAKKSV